MRKNIWPLLVLGALRYAWYTGWNPLAGWLPEPGRAPGSQAGGTAVVREMQQMPRAIGEMPNVTGSGAGAAQAARQAAQQAVEASQ